jgi:hypothetical protein
MVRMLTEKRNSYTVLSGEPKENTPLEMYGLRWEDNIKMGSKIGVRHGLDLGISA